MRADGSVQRLLLAVNNLKETNKLLATEAASASGEQNAPIINFNKLASSTAAACVGYFNIPSSITKETIEHFELPTNCNLLLNRVVVLSKDETALNGSVVGRTTPDPESCDLRIWASDIFAAGGRFVSLTAIRTPNGSITYLPDADGRRELAVDRIIVQGKFDHLTFCLYGWPIEIQSDKRFVATKKFLSNGLRHRIARLPVAAHYPDMSKTDADQLKEQHRQLTKLTSHNGNANKLFSMSTNDASVTLAASSEEITSLSVRHSSDQNNSCKAETGEDTTPSFPPSSLPQNFLPSSFSSSPSSPCIPSVSVQLKTFVEELLSYCPKPQSIPHFVKPGLPRLKDNNTNKTISNNTAGYSASETVTNHTKALPTKKRKSYHQHDELNLTVSFCSSSSSQQSAATSSALKNVESLNVESLTVESLNVESLSLPPVALLQQLATFLIPELKQYTHLWLTKNQLNSEQADTSREAKNDNNEKFVKTIISNSTWRTILSLLLSPFMGYNVYWRYFSVLLCEHNIIHVSYATDTASNVTGVTELQPLLSCNNETNLNDPNHLNDVLHKVTSQLTVPVFDSTRASRDQKALCIAMLTQLLSESSFLTRFFIALQGVWATAALANIELPPQLTLKSEHLIKAFETQQDSIATRDENMPTNLRESCLQSKEAAVDDSKNSNVNGSGSTLRGNASRCVEPYRIQVLAIRLLTVLSSHRHGVDALIEPVLVPRALEEEPKSLENCKYKGDNNSATDTVEALPHLPKSHNVLTSANVNERERHNGMITNVSFNDTEMHSCQQIRMKNKEEKNENPVLKPVRETSIYDCLILSASKHRRFARFHKRQALANVCHNVRLVTLASLCVESASKVVTLPKATSNEWKYTSIKRPFLVSLAEVLTCLMHFIKWDPCRLQELEELGDCCSSNLLTRFTQLTQVGSNRGERSDGLGPSNHDCSTRFTSEQFSCRFFKLIDGSSFLKIMAHCRFILLQLWKQKDITCTSEDNDSSMVASTHSLTAVKISDHSAATTSKDKNYIETGNPCTINNVNCLSSAGSHENYSDDHTISRSCFDEHTAIAGISMDILIKSKRYNTCENFLKELHSKGKTLTVDLHQWSFKELAAENIRLLDGILSFLLRTSIGAKAFLLLPGACFCNLCMETATMTLANDETKNPIIIKSQKDHLEPSITKYLSSDLKKFLKACSDSERIVNNVIVPIQHNINDNFINENVYCAKENALNCFFLSDQVVETKQYDSLTIPYRKRTRNQDTTGECNGNMAAETNYDDDKNDKTTAYLQTSLAALQTLRNFVAEPFNANALLTTFKSDIQFGLSIASVMNHLAQQQLSEEDKAYAEAAVPSSTITYPTTALSNATDKVTALEKVHQDAATLSALKCIIDIAWFLAQSPLSFEFLGSLFSHLKSCINQLSQIAIQSTMITSSTDSLQQRLQICADLCSSTGWGRTDVAIDTYASLDDTPVDNRTASNGLLSCLVPSSLFTGLRQVFFRESLFAQRVTDLASAWNLVHQGQPELLQSHDLIKRMEETNNNSDRITSEGSLQASFFLTQDDSHSSLHQQQHRPMVSKVRLTRYLISILHSVGATLSPNRLVPTSESVEIANAANTQSTSGSSISLRLGGFTGVVGVPTLDIQWPGYRAGSLYSETSALTANGIKGILTLNESRNITPVVPPHGWCMRTLLCLRMLNYYIATTPRYVPAELGQCLSIDDFAVAVETSCLDDMILALQTQNVTLRATLTSLLVGCSAAMAPPLLHTYANSSGHLEGAQATLWFSALQKMAPITEATLEFLYNLLDCILPTVPYPVSPILTSKVAASRTFPSLCRYASTAGTAWYQGELTDSGLLSAIVFLSTQLTQSWILLDARKIKSALHDEVLRIVLKCLDLICSLLRLWAIRCPSAISGMISLITRHSCGLPSSFLCGPLLISAIGGLGPTMPANEFTVTLGDSQPALLAPELNGAEGRNLDAVVGRLKQLYLQKRQVDSMRTGIGAGVASQPLANIAGSRLPLSMTTLTLSAQVKFPPLIEETFFGRGAPHFLQFHIPLAPPPPATRSGIHQTTPGAQQPLQVSYSSCGPGGYEWIHRRLGRLSMGHDSDILSLGIFKNETGKPVAQASQAPPSRLVPLTGAINPTATLVPGSSTIPDWASWDRVRDLLFESLEDEGVELTFESDRVPPFPLSLSPATIASITESRSQAKQMTRLLSQSNVTEGKRQLIRLEKIARNFNYLKVEDISELISLLSMCAFSSNTHLHAATAHAVATMTLTKGVPVFDILLQTGQNALRSLSTFLGDKLQTDRAAGVSQLFMISRLLIFVDNVFNLFPVPMLESAVLLTRLAAEGLKALQDIPVLHPSCPTYPVLMGLFDCLLSATVPLFRSGIKTFCQFVALLTQPVQDQAFSGLELPLTSVASHHDGWIPQQMTSGSHKAVSRFTNFMVQGQFGISLGNLVAVSHSAGAPSFGLGSTKSAAIANINLPRSLPLEALADFLVSLRVSCQGLCAVLNQLPVAWDCECRYSTGLNPLHSEDVNKSWVGLSVSTVNSILETLDLLASSRFLCSMVLFDAPGTFAETYLDTVQKACLETFSESAITSPLLNLSVSGSPDLAIKLDAFISTLTEAFTEFAKTLFPELLNLSPQTVQEESESYRKLSSILRSAKLILSLTTSFLTQCGTPFATLLLPLVTSEPVTMETFGSSSISIQAPALSDEAADLYADLDDVPVTADKKTETGDCSPSRAVINLRENCFSGLLEALQTMQLAASAFGGERNLTPMVQKLVTAVNSRIAQVIEVQRIIREELTMEPPILILRTRQLVEKFIIDRTNNQYNTAVPSIFLRQSSKNLAPRLPSGLPLDFGRTLNGVDSPNVVDTIELLVASMKDSTLWKNCAVLDTHPISNIPTVAASIETWSEKKFLCLSDVVNASLLGENLPSNTSVQSYFSDLATREPNETPPIATATVTLPTPPVWRGGPSITQSASIPSTVAGTPLRQPYSSTQGSIAEPITTDPFRARKIGPSSRAPSKHVDEFEAEQQAAAAAAKAEQKLDTDSITGSEPSLDAIPQWTEFVASGAEQGLDVMEILKTPQLLQYPHIEERFRRLVDLHPSIKTLFSMMELNI